MISDLGLNFSGFEDLRIVDLFKDENKSSDDLYDLDKWHLFETNNPNIFKGPCISFGAKKFKKLITIKL